MAESPDRISPEELARFLDGQLSAEQVVEFERRLARDPAATQDVEAQRVVDARLRSEFAPPAVTIDKLERLLRDDLQPATHRPSRSGRRRWLLLGTAITAAAVWAVVLWQWRPANVEPFFEPSSLTEIYLETVRQGFRPYYYCEDDERFALTFQKRQNVPLQLARMPDDRHMVGLSYSGGLSRDTTSILCRFQDQPIVVFVDRLEHDDPAVAMDNAKPGVQVHRSELDSLVVYEVGPFERPVISPYLEMHQPTMGQ